MKKLIRAIGKIIPWLIEKTGSAQPDPDTAGTLRDRKKIRKAAK